MKNRKGSFKVRKVAKGTLARNIGEFNYYGKLIPLTNIHQWRNDIRNYLGFKEVIWIKLPDKNNPTALVFKGVASNKLKNYFSMYLLESETKILTERLIDFRVVKNLELIHSMFYAFECIDEAMQVMELKENV